MVDKNTIFGGMLTTLGANKKTNCDALGIPWEPKYMLIGDANGTDPVPNPSQTQLINQVYRAQLNQLRVSEKDANILIAELVLPPDVGGWWIRELALEDKDGVFSAVSNVAPSYKPLLEQNSGRNQVVRMHIITNGTSNIQLKIDPSVVLATREYVDTKIQEELYKLDSKQSVRAATTANIALSGLQTIDGVSLLAGDRVLVKNQTAAKDNGIYTAAASAWQRAPDADSSAEVTSALILSVEQGTTQGDTRWQLVTDGTIILGATALTFQNITQGFAPLNSPALINPTANTPALFDNTLRVATTEFVKKNSGNHAAIGGLSANTTLTSANTFGMSYMLNSATPFTVTLPLASTSPNGGVVKFTNVLTAPVTLALQGADYMTGIDGVGAGGSIVLKQRDTITLSCAGSNVWYAEDGSVRDAQSTAIRSLIGNYSGVRILASATTLTAADAGLLCIGSGALAGLDITLPQLSTTVSGQSISISAGGGAFNLKTFAGDPGISIGLSVLSIIPIEIYESIILVSNPTGWRVISGTVLNKYSGMFAASLATNGYEKLPSGLIRQWCNGSIPAGAGSVRITLPITFPGNLIAYSFGTSAAAHWVTGQSASPSGIDVLARTISAGAVAIPSGVVGYTFECVGY
ncbi:phage tail protein [Pseudomonas sp. R151218B TE3479]